MNVALVPYHLVSSLDRLEIGEFGGLAGLTATARYALLARLEWNALKGYLSNLNSTNMMLSVLSLFLQLTPTGSTAAHRVSTGINGNNRAIIYS